MSEPVTLLRDQQQRVDRVQDEVEALRVNGFSRMREVTAVVQGTGRVASIAIDQDALRRRSTTRWTSWPTRRAPASRPS